MSQQQSPEMRLLIEMAQKHTKFIGFAFLQFVEIRAMLETVLKLQYAMLGEKDAESVKIWAEQAQDILEKCRKSQEQALKETLGIVEMAVDIPDGPIM